MISWSEIVRDAKEIVGFPHHFIEFDDTQIQKHLQNNCLRKFSTFFPEKWQMSLSTTDPNIRVPNRRDMVYVNDPEGREIFSIDEFIPTAGDLMMTGHPLLGAFNYDTIAEEMALGAFKSNNLRQFSIYNYTIKCLSPNMMRILPLFSGRFTVEYSRVHATDLSTLQTDLIEYFKDFCIAEFMMWLGSVRKNYTGVNTPFGEIPLNGDDLYSRGETKMSNLLERFETASAPFVIFDKG